MMRVVIDACVLYPTVLREIIVGLAAEGAFQPLWSARILSEWGRAVARNLPEHAALARAEIALLRARWPMAEIAPAPAIESRISLPDADDRHVLATAIAGGADGILTLNRRDFPTRTLARHGLRRLDPDAFLVAALEERPVILHAVLDRVLGRACRMSDGRLDRGALLKKARLTRLRRALGRASGRAGAG